MLAVEDKNKDIRKENKKTQNLIDLVHTRSHLATEYKIIGQKQENIENNDSKNTTSDTDSVVVQTEKLVLTDKNEKPGSNANIKKPEQWNCPEISQIEHFDFDKMNRHIKGRLKYEQLESSIAEVDHIIH